MFTPLDESQIQLFERLKVVGLFQTVNPKVINTRARYYKFDQRCLYYSGSIRHTIEYCINLKKKIQDLINQNAILFQEASLSPTYSPTIQNPQSIFYTRSSPLSPQPNYLVNQLNYQALLPNCQLIYHDYPQIPKFVEGL